MNSVNFGKSGCKVLSCSNKWIKCETSSAYNVYQVDNNGIDPSNLIFTIITKLYF